MEDRISPQTNSQEAEAQCAWLNAEGLVDGVVTDDNDVFLFGARTVYRNMFEDHKFAEEYHMSDIETGLGMTRTRLTQLALLLGSDYTEGCGGVGVVNAVEVVNAFSCLVPDEEEEEGKEQGAKEQGGKEQKEQGGKEQGAKEHEAQVQQGTRGFSALDAAIHQCKGLMAFRDWMQSPDEQLVRTVRNKRGGGAAAASATTTTAAAETAAEQQQQQGKEEDPPVLREFKVAHRGAKRNWQLPSDFPNAAVVEAYAAPKVDMNKDRFTFGRPDLQLLRVFCQQRFGWDAGRTDQLLVPVRGWWVGTGEGGCLWCGVVGAWWVGVVWCGGCMVDVWTGVDRCEGVYHDR